MQLLTTRTRIVLMIFIWLIAIGALALYLGSSRAERLTIAGGPAGSESLVLTSAIAQVINEADIGLRISVFETGGSYENLRLLENGRVDLAEIQADTNTSDSVLGLMTLYSDAYHLIARDGTGIHSFPELQGHRIAIPPGSSGKGITYQIVDCIEEKGIVTGKSFAGYQTIKIKKIPISEIKKYF